MSEVNFKVFLKDEIRRFTVDQSVCTNFTFIFEKLRVVFPILKSAPFKIVWKDSDGDDITLSNDDDLITAFTEMTGNTKILYVITTENARNKDTPRDKVNQNQGCPFSNGLDLNDFHALGALARQYLGPLLESMQASERSGCSGNQEKMFADIIQNAANGFFGNSPQNSAEESKATNSASSNSSSKDAKFAEPLAQLQQMGFSNENGILTNLLERFNGNVAAVVKELTDAKN